MSEPNGPQITPVNVPMGGESAQYVADADPATARSGSS